MSQTDNSNTPPQITSASDLLTRYAAGERDFHGANLSDANLSGAYLRGADLRGATLSGATAAGEAESGGE